MRKDHKPSQVKGISSCLYVIPIVPNKKKIIKQKEKEREREEKKNKKNEIKNEKNIEKYDVDRD